MERETIKDLIFSYGVILGKRHSEKQKVAFLRNAKTQFEKEHYKVDITKITSSFMKSEKRNFYNLYAGDFKHADTVIITYYDTPLSSIFPNKQKAFHSGYSRLTSLVQLFVLLLFMLLVASIGYFMIMPKLELHGLMSIWTMVLIVLCLLAFYVIMHIREGISNRFHMVRNSSSIISMFLIANQLDEIARKKVAFAFIDEGTQSEYGLIMFKEYMKKHKAKLMYLDSIGNEGFIQCFSDMAIVKQDAMEIHKREEYMKYYGDILLTSGTYQKDGVIIPFANTRKDKYLSEEKIKEVSECILNIVKEI